MIWKTLKIGAPVIAGYLALGSIFGFLFSQTGGSTLQSFWMAFAVYAGAAQYLLIEFAKSDVTFLTCFVPIILINLRHLFYGSVFLSLPTISRRGKLYVAFALTDETYSQLASRRDLDFTSQEVYLLTAINHFFWILGCVLGSLLLSQFAVKVRGLDFALTAMFIVLWYENSLKTMTPKYHAISIVSMAAAAAVVPQSIFVFFCAAVACTVQYVRHADGH